MKSKPRFVIAMVLAALMGGALVWMTLGGQLETYSSPGSLVEGKTYRLNALVAPGSPANAASAALTPQGVTFTVRDKANPKETLRVVYRGIVPDTFTDNREIVVTGQLQNGMFVAKRDTLLAKCPSKFEGKTSPNAT